MPYGDRLGNESSEDTWNFRGRGLLQITGKGTYSKIQEKINELASDSGVQIAEGKDEDYTPKEAGDKELQLKYKNKLWN